MQAWLEGNDILIRAKNALYEKALEMFEDEIKAGNISIKGRFVEFEEYSTQSKEEFLMLNLLGDKDRLVKFFADARAGTDSEAVRGFIDRINKIDSLITLSKVFDDWAEEALTQIDAKDAKDIINNGVVNNPARKEAIAALIETNGIETAGLLTKHELALFKKAIS
ncbi:MAG: hypothetical protein QXW57_04130 [Candidatus Micrarchaeaceae archaeon]